MQNLNGNVSGIIEIEKNVKQNECDDIGKLKRSEYNKEYQKTYRIKKKDELAEYHKNYWITNKQKLRDYYKEYRIQNELELTTKSKKYYTKNKKKVHLQNLKNKPHRSRYNKKYHQLNKRKINDYRTKYLGNRYKTDILYKIRVSLRNRVCDAFYYKQLVKSKRTKDMLGCTWEELKAYMEHLFKPGMSWDNHKRDGWHIDHIVPLAFAKTQGEMERLCHYKNLQPLWWYDNLSKGNK